MERLEGLENNRLVKIVAEELKDAGNVRWWGEYEVLQMTKQLLSIINPLIIHQASKSYRDICLLSNISQFTHIHLLVIIQS